MRLLLTPLVCLIVCSQTVYGQVEKAKEFLDRYNKNIIKEIHQQKRLKYKVYSDYTEKNNEDFKDADKIFQKLKNNYQNEAATIDLTDLDAYSKRQFQYILSSLTPKDAYITDNIFEIKRRMEKAFQDAKVPHDPKFIKTVNNTSNETLQLDINVLNNILGNLNAEPEEKLHAWKSYRDAIGPKVRTDYEEFVRFKNMAARANGYADEGAYKRRNYEVDNLEEIAEEFWEELKPFYKELHAYVRFRMSQKFGEHFKRDEAMPAHLLGNMWALTWTGIYDHIVPYPDQPPIDMGPGLRKKYQNTSEMFKATEHFFESLGWSALPSNFWRHSVLEPPKDGRQATCQPSAWDMFGTLQKEKDLRLIMCAELNHNHFVTAHHELGHLYYAMLYWDLPMEFREGANPAFHEAVGDTLALSVQVPKHLYDLGLLDSYSISKETDINFLLKMAVDTVAFLPYAYILDKWMWNVYNGNIGKKEYNQKWWELRLKYQGIKSPIERTEKDLDPATKYHLTADYPFIRYFFAVILQFTFHKHSCKAANYVGDLHQCSIYNSKEAGKAFGDMLKLGRSKPWPEQLKQFTGSEKLTADPILDYFAPLRVWLSEQRKKHDYPIGWEGDNVVTASSNSKAAGTVGPSSLMIQLFLLIFAFVLFV